MSSLTLILRSLAYHMRLNAAVALGVAAATAVLTGALLVGDSVRGSLRHLALDRLGDIDSVLLTQRFFRAELANETKSRVGECFSDVFPAILLQGTLDRPGTETRRASKVTVLGADERFWRQGEVRPSRLPTLNEVVLNETLADELQAQIGDRVILRLPQISEIPADSPLGRKTETSQSRGLTVIDVVPAESLGRFGLRPTQQLVHNAYTSIETLQNLLDQTGNANAIIVAGDETASAGRASSANSGCHAALKRALQPMLIDYGIKVEKTDRGYFNFTSDRMLIEPPAAEAILREFGGEDSQPVLVYLANYIKVTKGGKEAKIPYSTIAAVDFVDKPPLGPLTTIDGRTITKIADGEIVLNSWAADDTRAQGVDLEPGDTVTLEYFEPESTHGNVRESSTTFKLAGIVELAGVANDPNFTPELKGVTDKESIANWDPPFPYDAKRVRSVKPNDQDEQYWDEYKATPKGFIALETGQAMWGSRFGRVTSVRVPAADGMTVENVAARALKEIDPPTMGFKFLPVKAQGLEAAAGTTSFNFLFLGFSFFIIAAAVMLIALLFKLGVDQRASEIGVLLATGITQRKTRWLLVAEGAVVAAAGALAGIVAGIGYAWLMIYGLNHWWTEAIVVPFLELYVTAMSLLIGYVSGLIIAVLTIAWTLRQMLKVSVRRLLAGQVIEERFSVRRRAWAPIATLAMLVIAAGLVAFASQLSGEAQAGAFVGSGALVLGGLLATVWHTLRSDRSGHSIVAEGNGGALLRLAVRNGARAPMRSTMTIGLVAIATFLIVAISAFRLDPPSDTGNLDTGSGGFELIAESDQPIYQNLDSPDGRSGAGFDDDSEQTVARTKVIPLRVKAGDDASCLNLYQTQQPRVMGIPDEMINRGGFIWSATAPLDEREREHPWTMLTRPKQPIRELRLPGEQSEPNPIPVVLDVNTATYSLHLSGIGSRFAIDDGRGNEIPLEVVGLLKNSIFQGDILMSHSYFSKNFPEISGYRAFLLDSVEGRSDDVSQKFEETLGDYGFDVERTQDRLANFMAVQNTYLSTFQSLGGLGLLLGTFGLATVQLRNVLERRGELALMRATGFRRRRLGEMVMLENAALLCFGLGTGVIAATVAILPNLLLGDASIPWLSLVGTLALVLTVGLLAGLSAVRATLRAPLLEALRGE